MPIMTEAVYIGESGGGGSRDSPIFCLFFSFMGGKNEEGRREGTEGVSINNICERNNTAI